MSVFLLVVGMRATWAGERLAGGGTADPLSAARELIAGEKYAEAEALFRQIANDVTHPSEIREKARFNEAECLRVRERYPEASTVYRRLIEEFPSSTYRAEAVDQLFNIANYWLEDVREQMEQTNQFKNCSWRELLSLPSRCDDILPLDQILPSPADMLRDALWIRHLFHLDSGKPFLDEEGQAIKLLKCVQSSDPTGRYADKALFMIGAVRFYRDDYREADHYFSLLVETQPQSPLFARALELTAISKNLNPDKANEGPRLAEAQRLLERLLRDYGPPPAEKAEFLQVPKPTAAPADPDSRLSAGQVTYIRRILASITHREAEMALERADT
jgi:TolA-binding protein